MLARLRFRSKSNPDLGVEQNELDEKKETPVHDIQAPETKHPENNSEPDSDDSQPKSKTFGKQMAPEGGGEDDSDGGDAITSINVREKRVFASAAFIISGGPARHSRKCIMCGRGLRADRATWTRRVGGGLWAKDHPNLAKTLSEGSNPVNPAQEKEFDRCETCAHARERSDVAAMAAHRLLPVLTGVDKIEYADGSVYIGKYLHAQSPLTHF
jgi:hypothetical protein